MRARRRLSKRSGLGLAIAVVCTVAGGTFALLAPRQHTPPSLPVVAPSSAPAASAARQPAADTTAVTPARVIIPSIGVNATVVPEGLDSTGALETPPLSGTVDGQTPYDVGWWDGGYKPGANGPAVLVGHINSAALGNLVFANLSKMVPGEAIEIEPGNLWFTVTGTQEVGKDNFPTSAVYGPTPGPTLRLITCGGAFDQATGHYEDNFIVYASESTASG